MKILNKVYIFLILITGLSALGGCKEDFTLDLKPKSSITDGSYWQTEAHWESFITGIHSRLRGHHGTIKLLGSIRSDEYALRSYNREATWMDMISNSVREENVRIGAFGGFYTNINQCNLLIDKTLGLGDGEILSEANKNYILGQVYGIRAFYYLHLIRSWGDVPIYTEPSYGFDLAKLERPASPVSEVMKLIKDDIDESLKYFGNDYSFRRRVEWSKSATLMLKGEAYLWSSRRLGGGTGDAEIAKNALTDIQSNVPSLRLLDDFASVFSSDNKENDEIIFAIRNDEYEYQLWQGNDGIWYTHLLRDSHVNPPRNCWDSLTGGRFNQEDYNIITMGGAYYFPHNEIVFHRYQDDDPRKFETLQGIWMRHDDDTFELLPGPMINKFRGHFNEDGHRVLHDDFPIYRYAELLLMLAEAKSILGEDFSAEINEVRERGFAHNYQADRHSFGNLPKDGDDDEAILEERSWELFGEAKRWYDINRFGFEYVVKYSTVQAGEEHKMLWPLDVGTLTRNTALEQNPGY